MGPDRDYRDSSPRGGSQRAGSSLYLAHYDPYDASFTSKDARRWRLKWQEHCLRGTTAVPTTDDDTEDNDDGYDNEYGDEDDNDSTVKRPLAVLGEEKGSFPPISHLPR